MTTTLDALPPTMRGWVRAALDPAELPRERKADCRSCPMIDADAIEGDATDGDATDGDTPFLTDVRCCTFEPILANFQVGAFFRDASPRLEAGRRRLTARITARDGVTPLGIDRPATYPLWRAADERNFGRDPSLACGYLDTENEAARCTVHEARGAVCATWFCKHERGATGGRFWLALRAFLSAMEQALAHHCLAELGVGDEALLALTLQRDRPLDPPTPALYAALWGEHRFQEHRFYAACHELVEALDGPSALALGGATVARHRRALRAAQAALAETTIPERVTLGPRTASERRGERVALRTYRDSDPIVLAVRELEQVATCDGLSGEAAAARLGADRLRSLLDHEVLIADG